MLSLLIISLCQILISGVIFSCLSDRFNLTDITWKHVFKKLKIFFTPWYPSFVRLLCALFFFYWLMLINYSFIKGIKGVDDFPPFLVKLFSPFLV